VAGLFIVQNILTTYAGSLLTHPASKTKKESHEENNAKCMHGGFDGHYFTGTGNP
jgi:hypothetical protein